MICRPLLGPRFALSCVLLITSACAERPSGDAPAKSKATATAPAPAAPPPPTTAPDPPLAARPAPPASCPAVTAERVTLTTADGVELAADHYTSGTVGARGVVLLHMIPPHHTLLNYPRSFIDALVGSGFDVININRRGAPGSQGVAEDAYIGDKGKLDALAGVHYLLDSPCKTNPGQLVLVGASNGTTSTVDYTVHAHTAQDPRVPMPAALVFLSGGGYTGKQNPVVDQLEILGPLPARFLYPAKEAEWNTKIETLAKARALTDWSFQRFDPGAHGTKLFESDPDAVQDLAAWIDRAVDPAAP